MRKSASETTDALSQRRISSVSIPKRQSLGAMRQTAEGRLSRGSARRQSAPVKVTLLYLCAPVHLSVCLYFFF